MSVLIAAGLLAYALAVGVLADRALTGGRWVSARPRLGLLVWHLTAAALVAAVTGAALLISHDVLEQTLLLLLTADKSTLHLAYAGTASVPWLANLAVLLPMTLGAVIAAAFSTLAVQGRRVRRAMRRAVETTAGSARVQDAHLVPGTSASAFCIPGRRPLVVITSPTLDVLGSREIDAVLDHEREHLRRRHALQITWAEAVTSILARAGVLRRYAAEVRRLAELAADDAASARHGRRVVATALLAMSTHGGSATVGGLALAERHTAERIRRLLASPPGSRRRDALTLAGAATLTMVPLLGVLLPAAGVYW